jgi:DNA invertase Pin-like site-specific DNA recombinase
MRLRRVGHRCCVLGQGLSSASHREIGKGYSEVPAPDGRIVSSVQQSHPKADRDLLNVLEAVKQVGAGFRSLKDAWADTTTPHGQLMLTILGGLAEFERTLIRSRTGEGRERAKARGVRFGRPKKLSVHQRREAIDRINAGEAVAEVARTFGVDRATVYRLRPQARKSDTASPGRRPFACWSRTS